MKQCNAKAVVAVYDFDGTITDRHTFWRFLRLLVSPFRFWLTVITMAPWIIGIYYRGADIMEAREVLMRRLLKGLCEQQFNAAAMRFAHEHIPAWVKPAALESIRRHREAGNQLLLVSNSAKVYLEPWARSVGIETVYGSQFEVDSNGRLTGELRGTHCQGREKLLCLERHLVRLDDYEIHVFGDSDGDVAMLAAGDFAYYLTFDDIHRNDQRLAA